MSRVVCCALAGALEFVNTSIHPTTYTFQVDGPILRSTSTVQAAANDTLLAGREEEREGGRQGEGRDGMREGGRTGERGSGRAAGKSHAAALQ